MSALDIVARGIAARASADIRASSRHARLLRAADAAEGRNPVVRPAWLAPPAYAPSTSYAVGQVVTNGGNWYMCGIAGTSPASGGGPTTISSGQYIADGASALYWTHLGGARAADPGEGAPTVTIATSNPALGANWLPGSYPSAYTVRGATPMPYRSTFWSLATFEAKAGVTMSAGASVAFACDGDKRGAVPSGEREPAPRDRRRALSAARQPRRRRHRSVDGDRLDREHRAALAAV